MFSERNYFNPKAGIYILAITPPPPLGRKTLKNREELRGKNGKKEEKRRKKRKKGKKKEDNIIEKLRIIFCSRLNIIKYGKKQERISKNVKGGGRFF